MGNGVLKTPFPASLLAAFILKSHLKRMKFWITVFPMPVIIRSGRAIWIPGVHVCQRRPLLRRQAPDPFQDAVILVHLSLHEFSPNSPLIYGEHGAFG
jgi:hypothetical protein